MQANDSLTGLELLRTFMVGLIFKVGFLLFALIYFIFSLIVIRQVNLMSETLVTEGDQILKFIAIIHALFALGVIIYFILAL